jgi:hypothetical protein
MVPRRRVRCAAPSLRFSPLYAAHERDKAGKHGRRSIDHLGIVGCNIDEIALVEEVDYLQSTMISVSLRCTLASPVSTPDTAEHSPSWYCFPVPAA